MGIEPTTSRMRSERSTPELHPQHYSSFRHHLLLTSSEWSAHNVIRFYSVLQYWFSNICDVGNCRFKVEYFAQDNLEDLLNIDRMGWGAEYQRCFHHFRIPPRLFCNFFLFFPGEICKKIVFCSNKERNSHLVIHTCNDIKIHAQKHDQSIIWTSSSSERRRLRQRKQKNLGPSCQK